MVGKEPQRTQGEAMNQRGFLKELRSDGCVLLEHLAQGPPSPEQEDESRSDLVALISSPRELSCSALGTLWALVTDRKGFAFV